MMRGTSMLLVSLLAMAACSDSSGPEDELQVEIAVAVRTSAETSGTAVPINGNGALVLTGTNGILTIQAVELLVAEFELKRLDHDDVACKLDPGPRSACRRFESAPFLMDLPLNGSPVVVATEGVPFGTYTELEFEVEDLEDDDDDASPHDRQVILDLRTQLRALYTGISDETSMIVSGTFTPNGGSSRSFTVFVDAEIEIEMQLNPPLVIGNGSDRTMTLVIDPARWFRRGGQVLDLSAFNGRVLEIEVEIEDGFVSIEWDR